MLRRTIASYSSSSRPSRLSSISRERASRRSSGRRAYRLDYGWIDLPIFDDQGFPRHRRGVSEMPGLYFLGLPWLHTMASATVVGASFDGPYLADRIGL